MVFPIARVAARRTAAIAARQQQRRQMGGHAPAPEWTGIDKTVRDVVPEDWQLASAVMSGYSVLIGIAILSSGGGKKEEPVEEVVKVAAPTAPTGGIPSVDSDEFASYVETEAFLQLLDSEDQLAAALK